VSPPGGCHPGRSVPLVTPLLVNPLGDSQKLHKLMELILLQYCTKDKHHAQTIA